MLIYVSPVHEPDDPDARINRRSPVPEYRQLVGILRARIERGDWEVDTPIPTAGRFAQEYGLARNTVRRALRELIAERVLFAVPNRGTYVAERH